MGTPGIHSRNSSRSSLCIRDISKRSSNSNLCRPSLSSTRSRISSTNREKTPSLCIISNVDSLARPSKSSTAADICNVALSSSCQEISPYPAPSWVHTVPGADSKVSASSRILGSIETNPNAVIYSSILQHRTLSANNPLQPISSAHIHGRSNRVPTLEMGCDRYEGSQSIINGFVRLERCSKHAVELYVTVSARAPCGELHIIVDDSPAQNCASFSILKGGSSSIVQLATSAPAQIPRYRTRMLRRCRKQVLCLREWV